MIVESLLSIAAGILIIGLITAFTGYFVAQEFAFMSVDRSRLAARAATGDQGASRALTVTKRTSFMLSGAQLGITVTGLLVGYVAEPLIGRALGALIGGVGVPQGLSLAIGVFLAVTFSTVVQMVFGELFPKNLAIARPEPLATKLALSTSIYLRVVGWLIGIFDKSSNLLLRLVRIEPVHDVEHSATARDLEHIVADSREAGELAPALSILLDRVIDFPERTAAHAMIARSAADFVPATETVEKVLERMATGHTRYPVVGTDVDDLIGVVNLLDLLSAPAGDHVAAFARPAVIVAEVQPLADVLGALAEAHEELALVVDEYGGFAGIVTVEDMAEELVGEIEDEHDDPALAGEEIAGDLANGWTIPGSMHLDEVERLVDVDLPVTSSETLAGLVIEENGGLPQEGDQVEINLQTPASNILSDTEPTRRFLRATVVSIDQHVPASLTVQYLEEADDVE